MWPDPEVATNAAAADKVPTEKFAMMPHWMGIGYWLRGRHGYWNSHLTGNIVQQVGSSWSTNALMSLAVQYDR